MKNWLKELRKYLDDCYQDCLKLKKGRDLTKEGFGELAIIQSIYPYFGWKHKNPPEENN